MKKVVFFNHWNNGDIHVSRGIIKQIVNKVHQIDPDVSFTYSHKNPANLLVDIPNLGFDAQALQNVNPQDSVVTIGDTVYINTWYDQQHHKYARQWGILTIDALYIALNDACKQLWNFSLPNCSEHLIDFFPIIDYSKYQIQQAQTWLQEHPGKKVLVGNGNVLSGQAHNFDLIPIIISLANIHPDTNFILSQKNESVTLPTNVTYTSDIIKKSEGSDLNEISFLSTHCDLIIGKASGVFTFSVVKENLFERKIKFLCFSHLMFGQSKFWMGKLFQDRINYSSNILVTNEHDTNKVLEIINRSL